MTLNPRTSTSPGSFAGSERPVSSTQRTSTPAIGTPQRVATISSGVPRGQIVTVPVDSVSP